MAPTSLQKAERERDSVKTTIRYLESKLRDHTVTPIPEIKVDHYLRIVTSSHEKVIVTHEAICAQAPADMDPYNVEYMKLLDAVSDLQCSFQEIKRAFAVSTTGPSTSASAAAIRLPRIELPTFSGKLEDWMAFRDLFVSAVHDNTNITKAQKLTYLKTSLTGEAGMQIKSLSLTNANYDIAWAQLTDRYQNERELLFSILSRFVGQPNVQSGSASALRSLVDTSKECFRSLDVLKRQVNQWDDILLFHIFQKLDPTSKELWEQSLKDSSIPSLKLLLDFIEQRARALAAGATSSKGSKSDGNNSRRVNVHHAQSSAVCKVCSSSTNHPIYKCTQFQSMSPQERFDTVRKTSLCINCLGGGHTVSKCTSKGTCRICSGRHNTLLHKKSTSEPNKEPSPFVLTHHSNDDTRIQQTMLATALVRVKDSHGQHHTLRALLDGGSTSSFITDSCVQRLRLSRNRTTAEVTGLAAASVGTARGIISLVFSPHFPSDNSYSINCLILPKVTGTLPVYPCDHTVWPHLQGIQLADPEYYKPAEIDVLLGADVFWNLLMDGKRTTTKESPIGLRSTLGWLVAGNLNSVSTQIIVHYADVDLDASLRQFWEIESAPTTRALTVEELDCEEHFLKTHRRAESGRFVVQLPFKDPLPAIGNSRDAAVRRLKQLERRFMQHPHYHEQYVKFMNDYLALGHMELLSHTEIQSPKNQTCYIPHHFVLKESSTTTKLRVVFDASSKTSTGVSLNDSLMVGPTLQDTLVSILIRFRIHVVAFTADIAKMYRQIVVDSTNADMQRIVWRTEPSEPIQDFRLLTVTYGTASAPYLATKSLQQLAMDEKNSLPLASQIALNDFYVDDVMSGSSTLKSALNIQSELLELTRRGGFELRKWSSNCPALLEMLPVELRETESVLQIETDHTIKALGVFWNSTEDKFLFRLNLPVLSCDEQLTKRKVLSEIAKIFDPLGWLAPIIIRAKIIMQKLWKLQLGWDESLPSSIQLEWITFRNNLPQIEEISIERCTVPQDYSEINLVGFCDASELAYAAAVYLCVYTTEKKALISLISSKTRVAPAKQISLPKLELCGADLLAHLMVTIDSSLKLPIANTRAYTDSTVVLGWIQSHPSRWKTFVANRVTAIQRLTPSNLWFHVDGTENPSDCASRGIDPVELKNHPLWWTGPSWLQIGIHSPAHQIPCDSSAILKEQKSSTVCCNAIAVDNLFLRRFSNLHTLTRAMAYVFRFYHNCRAKLLQRRGITGGTLYSGPLTADEKDKSLLHLIQCVQSETFHTEIHHLQKRQQLPLKSKLSSLNPFLDPAQTLRVGGRLRNAALMPDQKTPIVLPRHHYFTQLLIMSKHMDNLHAGPQMLQAIIHQKYWIIGAKDAIRQQIRKCVTCTRFRAQTLQQLMGDLPSHRVTPSRAFSKCGVDFAGAFNLRAIPSRSKVTFKAYIALFVCFTTRAVHLEVVSQLSTDAFIAALKRFIARRGHPSDIFSDCGTNFVGAANEMKEMVALISSSQHNQRIANSVSDHGTQWHFNPAAAPHMGGLWEAGIKSAKFHLHRVVGSARLTFEEMTTITAQIEAVLNSRPLTAMSTDPNDMTALTPGHFLIGAPLTALPEPDITGERVGRLSRWQHLQQLHQHFWNRWSNEYLSRLQQRPKWLRERTNIEVGDMVLIKDDRLPPLKWKLGRVTENHPGKDGLTRVVTLQTAEGILKRPIVKLCLLPISERKPTTCNFNCHFYFC